MTRTIFPMAVADMSAFARSLRQQIATLDHKPSHLEMLNLLSRAGGFRNYQHFRAEAEATGPVGTPEAVADRLPPLPDMPADMQPDMQPDEKRVMHTLRVFDRAGRITRWPGKRSQQQLCMWYLWSKIPRGRSFSEREIGDFLNTLHLFGDPALLRRDLFDLGLVTRNRDGSNYRRVERRPPPELGLLTRRIGTEPQRAPGVGTARVSGRRQTAVIVTGNPA
ncbi:DUF2087 domain-containing protein [Neorhizobium sp. NCHU2750]|uniref:DUF2087 domain-containing protein n=1 Tax=Neorhizobium sp. NCHU2750 TaxID=1825976 RepID=UPI000E708413|nr:hypothetical protein NCHU2750_14400 [Neorhizobium sp. NCHU2750]